MLGLLMGLGLMSTLVAPPTASEQEPLRDLITVEGQAEVLVPPDKVAITLTIERRAQSQVQAETAVKTAADAVLSIAREHGVKEADIDASDYALQPLYEWSGGKRLAKRLGFLVRRTLVVTLRELPRFGSLLSHIVETDAVSVTSVDPAIEDTRAHRDKARLMAIRAAREKAQAIVAELGQSLGRAVTIEVDGASSSQCCGATGGFTARANSNNLTIDSTGPSYALGAITLTARVKVAFELK
jgi:uncharacterized protein